MSASAAVRLDPILPGDKVTFKDAEFSRAERACFTANLYGVSRQKSIVHSVRTISVHPLTGEQVIHLVGCYWVSPDSAQEPGFPASRFHKVSDHGGSGTVGIPEMIHLPVEVSPRVVRQLTSLPLFPVVETIHEWENEEKLEVACRRWENVRHQSKPIRVAGELLREEISEMDAVILSVPMSSLGRQNLDGVCERLRITPEVWLQGVLHNLAFRCQKMRENYEMCLRNAHRKRM